MKQLIVLCAAVFALQTSGTAQKITGKITDLEGTLMDKASVSLLRAKDSSIVKLDATDKQGTYKFISIPNGDYLVSATTVGYAPVFSKSFNYSGTDVHVPNLLMYKTNTQLSMVTVTARKPLVEVKADKMIVNVEGTINATGNDGLELLRKSPGIMIDKDDNISMAGKNGVQIYIDGKPSPLRGSDLANYLRSMQSTSIEAIELITNPSAKYDAAGNAGIINIRLKKDKSLGTNGSITAGYNVSTYAKYNGGFSLNHRNKKFNAFGNYNYNQGKYFNKQSIYREQADSIFDQPSVMKMDRSGHNFKAGIDYYLSKKSTLGAVVNGNIFKMEGNNDGPMEIKPKSTMIVDRILRSSTNMDMDRENYNFNLNYKFSNGKGRELNIDADYGIFDLHNKQLVPNIYYKADGTTVLYNNTYRMNAPTDIDIYSLKADYEHNFYKGKLGYGAKLSWVNTDNNFSRYNFINNAEVYDRDYSNRFQYKENINAAYVNYNRPFKGFLIQLGLRVENTNSEGLSTGETKTNSGQYIPFDSTVKRNYTDLFPSAALTLNKNPMSQWSFTYSRRIDRPNYSTLNPFRFYLNDYTYMIGNTQLKPQYTNSFGITHTYKYRLNTTLNYSHVTGVFAQIMEPTENSKSYQTTKNLATQDIISLNVSYPFSYKKYSLFANFNSAYNKYKADFGGGNRVVNLDVFSYQLYVQNTFKLDNKWTAELSGLYLSPFIWQGVFKGKAMSFVDLGLQRSVLKGKGTVKASVSDIFNTMRFRGTSDYAGTYTKVDARWESRQFKLNFTYRFGSAQVKAARQRKTAAEDETNRAANGGAATPGQ